MTYKRRTRCWCTHRVLCFAAVPNALPAWATCIPAASRMPSWPTGFEAKDEAKGTNEIVGQALVRAGNQLASERLTVGPAAGGDLASIVEFPRPWTLRSLPCPSVIAGAVSASPPRMRAVWAGRRSLQAPLHRE